MKHGVRIGTHSSCWSRSNGVSSILHGCWSRWARPTVPGRCQSPSELNGSTDGLANGTFGIRSPEGLFWLLQTGDESTFCILIGSSKCEPRHAGLAACLAFAGWADGRSALGVLKHVSDDQFREFVTQLERFRDRDSVFAKVVSDSDLSRALVGQLIRTPLQVSPGWFEGLLSATRCGDSNWHKYWLKEKRLEGAAQASGDQLGAIPPSLGRACGTDHA